eukprot:scaffold141885_cov23-Tisochrysis_lutea.AAC.1
MFCLCQTKQRPVGCERRFGTSALSQLVLLVPGCPFAPQHLKSRWVGNKHKFGLTHNVWAHAMC